MIPHTKETYPSGFVAIPDQAQRMGERLDRQEVTPEWYLDNMADKPLWSFNSIALEFGTDPWKLNPDDIFRPGMRLFVQRKDIPSKVVAP